jgi:hypothetical protein
MTSSLAGRLRRSSRIGHAAADHRHRTRAANKHLTNRSGASTTNPRAACRCRTLVAGLAKPAALHPAVDVKLDLLIMRYPFSRVAQM